MDVPPDDIEARLDELERWAGQQRRRLGPATRRARLRAAVAGRLTRARGLARDPALADRLVDRIADRLLGRGLDTATHAVLPEHSLGDRVGYLPSAWHVLPRALRYVGVSERDTFVDFGCGKGRIVHQAARWPFGRVIGVEVSPELADVARGVLAARAHQHRCRNVEIVVSDVAEFPVPDDMTTGYFYRPFGDETLEAVLRAIVESIERNPRRVRLIYLWPRNSARSAILATGRFRLVKEQRTRLINPRSTQAAIFESDHG